MIFFNSINIGLFKKILIFLNNFFLREGLKEFIGNSAGSKLAKFASATLSLPFALSLASSDYNASMDASRIVIDQGIMPTDADFQSKVAATKASLRKTTVIGSFLSKRGLV